MSDLSTIAPSFTLESLALTVSKGPFLGIDWGKTNVGIAISDPENQLALPLEVVQAGSRLRYRLSTLWDEYQVQALIIGWPLHLDGREGLLCKTIERLALRLFQDHQWPIAFFDERMTSKGVQSMLCDHKKVIDHHAAALILQGAIHRWTHLVTQTQ